MDRLQASKLKKEDSDEEDVEDDAKGNAILKQDFIDTVRLVYITFKSMEAKELVQQLFIKDEGEKEESNIEKLF